MVSSKTISLAEIERMLRACGTDFSKIVQKKHRHWVYCNGLIYRGLPLGKHGPRKNPEIEIGHVRQLVRHLGIDPTCAEKQIPTLRH